MVVRAGVEAGCLCLNLCLAQLLASCVTLRSCLISLCLSVLSCNSIDFIEFYENQMSYVCKSA